MHRIDLPASALRATDPAAIATAWSRRDFLTLFPSPAEAVAFEDHALSCGRALLPAEALRVLDNAEAGSDYYAWLADQVAGAL